MTENSHYPQVLVLLSTFNGEEFLEELLTSLLKQEDISLTLLVRDDGSVDRTIDILRGQVDKSNMKVIEGSNVGADESFKILMKVSERHPFDYIAFCDQDDIWMPDKLNRSIEMLQDANVGHYSSKRLVYADKKMTLAEYPKKNVTVNFENSIFENVAPGCTTVISRSHFIKLMELGCSEISGSYDHIIHLMSTALNQTYFDQEARILYRIHQSNAVGIATLRNRSFTKTQQEVRQKKALLESIFRKLNAEMNDIDRNFATEVLRSRNFCHRAVWVFFLPKMRQNLVHDLFLKIFLLYN
jgi:glycosyltransferase involved in cell wall biosynthesis